MKNALLFICAILLISGCTRTIHKHTRTIKHVKQTVTKKVLCDRVLIDKSIKQNEENIVYIHNYLVNHRAYIGTGFIVDKKAGLIATAHHIMADGPDITKTIVAFKEKGKTIKKVVDWYEVSKDRDIAILHINHTFKTQIKFRKTEPSSGEPIFALGYPYGLQINPFDKGPYKSHGYFYAYGKTMLRIAKNNKLTLQMYEDVQLHQMSVGGGTSGGPIFDKNGRVVGSIIGSNGFTAALPARHIKSFLTAVKLKKASLKKVPLIQTLDKTP